MKTYIKIENDTVTNVINGESDGYVENTLNANIGDIIRNGSIVAPADTRDWKQKRIDEYGTDGFQKDLQYWDSIHGTNLWRDHVTFVKAKYPKKPVYQGWWHTNALKDMANGQGTRQIIDVVGDKSNTSYPTGSSTSIPRYTYNPLAGQTESSFVLELDRDRPIVSYVFELDNELNSDDTTPTIAWYAVDEHDNETLLYQLDNCVHGNEYALANPDHVSTAKYKFKVTGLDAGKPIRLINGVATVYQDDFDANPFS